MTNILWDKESLSQALNDCALNNSCENLSDDINIKKITIDSRKIEKNDLFIAIKGENYDGHNFVGQAFAKGAAAAIVNAVPTGLENISLENNSFKNSKNLIIVPDTAKALVALASYNRLKSKAKFIAITGSLGKTSTKEMAKLAFSQLGKTYASIGNFNNHYGLPLSLANMPQDTKYAIFELGMSAKGEISYLTNIVKADAAIITKIAAVHLEFFNSVKEIAYAKAEIFEGLGKNGIAVINYDSEYYNLLKEQAGQNKNITKIFSFGTIKGADFRLLNYQKLSNIKTHVQVAYNGGVVDYDLNFTSLPQIVNSISVLATITALKGDVTKAVNGLSKYELVDGRGKTTNLNIGDGNITIIDDCYNASPESVKAALDDLSSKNGRKIAILGDMYELGSNEIKFHQDLLSSIISNKIDVVYTIGKIITNLHQLLPDNIKALHFADSDSASEEIKKLFYDGSFKNNDVILIKGSRGVKMEKIVNILLQIGEDIKHVV